MRPLWFEFPDAPSLFGVDDEFMLGPALLVAPVLDEGAQSREVTLPAGPVWYDAAAGAVLARALHAAATTPNGSSARTRGTGVARDGTQGRIRSKLLCDTFSTQANFISWQASRSYGTVSEVGQPLPATSAGEVAGGGQSTFGVPVTLDTVPVYLRGGHIIARRERARRSTAAMHSDPLTLVSTGHSAL